ncbi:putative transcription factor C3H family [Dioscorea sansibarensis]
MQQEMMISGSIKSEPFTSPDRRFPLPPYLSSGIDLFGLYSPKNPTATSPASLTPSSISFEDETEDHHDAAITDSQLYLARLTLQYRQLADRYDLCLSHLQDAADELEALRQENAELRISKNDLAKRLSEIRNGRAIVDEFRRLRLAEEGTSPTSVLGGSFSHSEKRVTLPKSISIRSSGFLRLNSSGRGSGPSSSARFSQHQQQQQHQHQHQKVYLGSGEEKKGEVEVEVYNQGMFKTELCNKWEETGECPYGEHCQFAHGIGELRPVIRHPRYKTEVCRMVLSGDTCPYGHRCHFRHALSPTDRLN